MILLDASASLSEKSFNLAMATAFNILDTLGEDDYVNLITFSEVIKTPVPCFKDRMVRATPDNIQEIKSAVKAIKLQDTSNFTAGLEYAFSLLHKVCGVCVDEVLSVQFKIWLCSTISLERAVSVIKPLWL